MLHVLSLEHFLHFLHALWGEFPRNVLHLPIVHLLVLGVEGWSFSLVVDLWGLDSSFFLLLAGIINLATTKRVLKIILQVRGFTIWWNTFLIKPVLRAQLKTQKFVAFHKHTGCKDVCEDRKTPCFIVGVMGFRQDLIIYRRQHAILSMTANDP